MRACNVDPPPLPLQLSLSFSILMIYKRILYCYYYYFLLSTKRKRETRRKFSQKKSIVNSPPIDDATFTLNNLTGDLNFNRIVSFKFKKKKKNDPISLSYSFLSDVSINYIICNFRAYQFPSWLNEQHPSKIPPKSNRTSIGGENCRYRKIKPRRQL